MGSDSENEKSGKDKKKIIPLAPIAKPLAGKKPCKRTLKQNCREKVLEKSGGRRCEEYHNKGSAMDPL